MRAERLKLVPTKNQRRNPITVEIPVIPALRRLIDAAPNSALTFIATDFGKPFTANGFGNRFRKWCVEAEAVALHGAWSAQGRARSPRGCTDHEIMAITGHQTMNEVARYTAAANRKRLAQSGMAKFARAETGNESFPLLANKGEGGTVLTEKPCKTNALAK